MKRALATLTLAFMLVAVSAPTVSAQSTTTTTKPAHAKNAKKHKKKVKAKALSCPASVDALAAAYNANADDATINKVARVSLTDCGPGNGGGGATDWEVAGSADKLNLGSTDIHDVLAAFCHDIDHSRKTNVCQDSIIADLTKAMDQK